MKTIVEVALATKFTESQVPVIMEVINATPNPEMATQILLGIWVKPVVYHSMYRKRRNYGKNLDDVVMCFAKDINLWEGMVSYTYEKPEMKSFYVPKDTDESLVTLRNYQDFKCDYDHEGGYKSLSIPTGNMVEVGDTCTLAEWTSWEKVEETAE
jgi:hypothetical protein